MASQIGFAASALPGTWKFDRLKYDIHNPLASSRKTNERVGDSHSAREQAVIAKDHLYKYMHVYTSAGFCSPSSEWRGAPCHALVSAIQGDNYVISMASQLDIVSLDDVMK